MWSKFEGFERLKKIAFQKELNFDELKTKNDFKFSTKVAESMNGRNHSRRKDFMV